ncbi:unnamed protein product [Kluyveromyces dobzhanskii CBS 2104]|uniref:WGS project CCBQ000000000 data, contig 00015 n=1 Tax=Kluyveromyces dobzhanskii CBS 2104 TaxID=1427455 RepID=A0A0A8LCG4_9SACH|nr:unnamed protein product [Kluyveromyces dobzhanskii CBS 2104]
MIKSRYSVYQVNHPSNNAVTPIRTCREDKYELTNFYKMNHNPYSNPLWNTSDENREALQKIKESAATKRLRHDDCPNDLQRQSIIWDSDKEPQNKKSYSPLDIENFSETMKLETPRPDSKTLSFVQTLQKLVQSEQQYCEMISLCLSTYKEEACCNKKFKNKFLNKASNDELLLFGNLDTMAELSKLFHNSLLEMIKSAIDGSNQKNIWNEIKASDRLCQYLLRSNFSTVIKSHLHRIKSPYRSYCICHEERKRFLGSIKLQHTETFYKWYEMCLKKSHFEKLEDLLELPLERLGQWGSLFETLSLLGDNLLPSAQSVELNAISKQYIYYLRELNDEIHETGPKEENSLQDYTARTHRNDHGFEQSTSEFPLKDVISLGTSQGTSHVSKSSSFYSDIPSTRFGEDSQQTETNPGAERTSHLDSIKEKQETKGKPSVPLKESIKQFNCTHANLQKWDKVLCKLELANVLDRILSIAIAWKDLIEFEPPNEMFIPGDNERTIYGTYVEKIDKQRQQVMILQLQELRRKVIKPLQHLLQRFATVKQKLADRNLLKKEYMEYLRHRETETHDTKKQILANSFQQLQYQLTESLPVFNKFAKEAITLLVSQYTLLMMEFMQIISGGDQFLNKELELVNSGVRELGDNFDILQLFCSSRYYTRHAIRENWTSEGDPRASRVVRKLFEL